MIEHRSPVQARSAAASRDESADAESTAVDAVKELGTSKAAEPGESDIHVLTVIGQIEGHITLPSQNKTTKYEHVLPQLVAVEQNDKIKGLLVL
ncbi:MAG: translocation-enhancing protein TepA, partial [Clostridia bacterium]|nr:translocation-enhancing protein TepA [Clostridia bacterium]